MKKILIVFGCLSVAQMSNAQTWNVGLNSIPGNPYFGTNNAKPVNFFTNNTMRMTISQTGQIQINDMVGSGDRFLQADPSGQLKTWTGSVANANKILMGDNSWKVYPFGGDVTTVTLPTAGSKLGIGVTTPASAVDVSGDISATGMVKAPGGHLFSSNDGIYFNSTDNVFFVGKGTSIPPQPLLTGCGALPAAATWLHVGQGGYACSQINPAMAPLVNANLRMYVAPANGNGFIEVDGKNNLNATNNSLNLNYNCGRVTNINTGSNGGNVNICSGPYSNLGIGTTALANSRVFISGDQTGLNVTTAHTADNNYNTQLNVNRNYTKALGVINVAGGSPVENFIVYGDGRTRIGGDYLTPNENMYKLSVNGMMITEEVVIMLRANWPDYVFKKDYKLMPLNKLEEYLKTNSHLPNIPSAADIKSNGLNTGELISKQMEKIEELTLYLIQLKKDVDQLKSENEALKKSEK